MPRNKNWYSIENKSAAEATIYIYDEISSWGISAKQFVKDLNDVTAKIINLRINSPGGNVFDGAVIHNALKEHAATINVKVDGLAASIASVIAMAGDSIHMANNAMMMIHQAWTYAAGNSTDMRKTADLLDKVDETIVSTYANRTAKAVSAIKQMMADETWMTAAEAKSHGFADTIGDEEAADTTAKASFDIAKFNYAKVPQAVLESWGNKHNEHTERDIEQLLRDAGVSRAQAKAAVAVIRSESLRDAEEIDEETAMQLLAAILNLNKKGE
jgi:ATP-dependent protease ClpP protease subunit